MSTDTAPVPKLIEIGINDVDRLFNSMDPSPFRERDLDHDADEYIVSWAHEYPLDAPLALRIHLEEWPADNPTGLIIGAVHHYFAYRAGLANLEFRRTMRQGRTSFLVGLAVLVFCLGLSQALAPPSDSGVVGFLSTGLNIAGWVAMSRALETWLFDWWPVRRRERIFKKLSVMAVEVVHRQSA